MGAEGINMGMPTIQKPQVYVKRMVFNDGTPLALNHSSIVVFTGANNSGKEWVYEVVEKYDLATDPKLEDARRFVAEIVEYTPRR